MGKERVIFSNRFDRPTLEEIEAEIKKENLNDTAGSMTGEEFLDFMQKNKRTVPNEKCLANKDKFIWAVRELSETYEIDADLRENFKIKTIREGTTMAEVIEQYIKKYLTEN